MYNDDFNAKIFIDKFKNDLCYSKPLGGWQLAREGFWFPDENHIIKKYALQIYELLKENFENQPFTGTEEQKRYLASHIKSTGMDSKLNSMINCAQPSMTIETNKFDADGNLFNLKNFTLALNDGNLQAHDPLNYLTKISNVQFDIAATCPKWLKFLDEIFLRKQEIIDFMQRAVGYALSTSTKEQCIFILHGIGNNGKGVFLNVLAHMMGNYAAFCPASTFIRKNNNQIPNDVAMLRGSRMVIASESNQNVSFDEALIKQLTGGDTISARFLNKEWFSFKPTFKIFFMTNHAPNIRDAGVGIWRRIRMIPFNLKITPGSPEENKDLTEELLEEIPGIFNWAYRGYLSWSVNGLNPPEEITNATNKYRAGEDDIGQFIDDYCNISQDAIMPINEFKNKFKIVNGYFKSQKILNEYMIAHDFKPDRRYINNVRQRVWIGIKFNENYQQEKWVD